MTGRDAVAVVLALGIVAVVFVYVVAVIFYGYVPSGDGVLGAVVGALLVVVTRYLGQDRRRL